MLTSTAQQYINSLSVVPEFHFFQLINDCMRFAICCRKYFILPSGFNHCRDLEKPTRVSCKMFHRMRIFMR